jgi:hypothetical protein
MCFANTDQKYKPQSGSPVYCIGGQADIDHLMKKDEQNHFSLNGVKYT